MTLPPAFWNNLLIAAALGLAVGVSLWLIRRSTLGQRLRVSAGLAVVGLGVYLAELGLGSRADDPVLQVTLAVVIMVSANTLLQLFDWLFWDYLLGRRRHVAVPRLVVDLFNFLVLAGVAVAVLNRVFGVTDLSAFLVTSTVLSAVVGLAVQDTLANVAAGLALQAEHPFAVGDWVRLSGEEGQVVQMNWRTITLRTRDNHNVLLPNTNAAKELIINYSRPTPLQRMHARVGVAYGHPPEQVKQALQAAVAGAAGVAAEPAPQAQVEGYADFAIQYLIYYWITDFSRVPEIHDAVMTRLWYALRRAGFGIPFPVRDVTVRMLSDDHAAQVQARQQREVFAELRGITLFAPLADAVVEQLARGAVLQPYAAGEVLVRQGEPGQSLFVIKSGRVRVDARGEAGQVTTVARLGPDDFFGEMSLLTGEPRSASVIAEIETEVVVVDKAGLATAIATDARLPEVLSEALAARQRSLAEQVSAAGIAGSRLAPLPTALLGRIRRFFGIG
jgi:small-conductance mechanosensitive channel/CRP-like cAMP-binding protein